MSTSTIQLKGSLFTLTVLQLQSSNMDKLHAEIRAKVQLAPNFFKNAPVVIDVTAMGDQAEQLDFVALREILTKNKLIPVGIKGASERVQMKAISAGLACISENHIQHEKNNRVTNETEDDKQSKPTEKNAKSTDKTKDTDGKETKSKDDSDNTNVHKNITRLITQPIRSGQQIYSTGDLIIVAPVSPGAELLAEGSIHIYDRMRGRALAGVNGDQDARIFCKQLEAELIAIAGEYQIFEHTEYPHMSKPTQIYLEDGKLVAEPL